MRLLKKSQTASAAKELFLQTALSYLGYQPELLGRNKFGQKVGYDSVPWSGAFVDVCAREAGIPNFASFVNTAAGLGESLRNGQDFRVPEVGDIVVFNFSSNVGFAASPFSMMHCGIVTDVREFENSGRFVTVEANTEGSSAATKRDGVHQKVRHMTDVLTFCRPRFRPDRLTFNGWLMKTFDAARTTFTREETDLIEREVLVPKILKLNGEIRYGDRNKRVEIIQLALAMVTDLRSAEPGRWDTATAAACSRFQRNIGRTGYGVTGLPDLNMLKRLSHDTGVFILES